MPFKVKKKQKKTLPGIGKLLFPETQLKNQVWLFFFLSWFVK
jgi:hypothetical protein